MTPSGDRTRPRIVIMPGNDALSDARVLKNLATAARLGLDAIAVGVVRGGPGREVEIGEARVVVVPVPPRVGHVGARAWWRRLGELLRPWYATESEQKSARARLGYEAREAAAGHARKVRDAGRPPLLAAGHPSPPGTLRSVWRRARLLLGKVVVRLRSALLRRRLSRELGAHEVNEQSRTRAINRARRGPRRARWRHDLSVAVDDEIVLGRVLDDLRPDLIHVHDVFMMGVAARAAGRAAVAGRRMRLVYDAREYLPGLAYIPPRTVAAYCDLEREFIADFDRVVTVSAPLAELLRDDHRLAALPDLVLNAPTVDAAASDVPSVRAVTGVPDGAPLLVYGGGVNPARGVQTIIDALPLLPDAHFALVVNHTSHVVVELRDRAERLGVADRFHLAPFVPPEHVTRYFASADVGISPLLHVVNHDVALTNKFCEYLLAGLPVVTSDTPAQADLVREFGIGEVYRAGDVADLVRAVTGVLAAGDELRARVADPEVQRRFSWEAQAEVLREVYSDLLGELPAQAWEPGATTIGVVSR